MDGQAGCYFLDSHRVRRGRRERADNRERRIKTSQRYVLVQITGVLRGKMSLSKLRLLAVAQADIKVPRDFNIAN